MACGWDYVTIPDVMMRERMWRLGSSCIFNAPSATRGGCQRISIITLQSHTWHFDHLVVVWCGVVLEREDANHMYPPNHLAMIVVVLGHASGFKAFGIAQDRRATISSWL
mmetsp:Transcript_13396/g.22026  ORF Transcript_13396/g.22026 Transcript_13396/m.22026 type:complete len:110 (+) Transcript_13396:1101-1430(+)